MSNSNWPEWLEKVWAKSAEGCAGSKPESLARHTWEVLSRLAELIRLRPDLPQALGVPRLWQIIFWAGFMHDWGKVASGFQARLRGGKRWPHRHEVLSLAFLDWIADDFTDDERAWVAAAIVSHHKDAGTIQHLYPLPDDMDDEDQLVARVAEIDEATILGLWRWLDECAAAWIDALGLDEAGVTMPSLIDSDVATTTVRQQGAARIRYWLDVYRRFLQMIECSDERSLLIGTLALRGHLINADHSASAHAGVLPRLTVKADAILSGRQISRDDLFEHQLAAEKAVGSTLLVAPTGSGKTEAALLWAARQSAQGNSARLFYTLPYQASMNAMKLRLEESFGTEMVGLQHGRSLPALYRLLLDRNYGPREAARQARRMRDLARLNYPPVRVFSPYLMLKGMYRLRGYEAMLTDYHDAVFVFDEIHAYEVERLALILKTIEYLSRNYNARFLVMSATLPTLIKDWLRQALGEPVEIMAEPALFAKFRRHQLFLLDGELASHEGLGRIAADARAGKSVLVVCNLVDRAQAAYRELRKRLRGSDVHVELLHGSFNARDRLGKETLVHESAGATAKQRRPIVLVATQVVEVSLDIDLDVIYTEPAPLEALLQRFGRINRRGKKGLVPVYVYRQPTDGQHVYADALIAGALKVLERENGKSLDESAVGDWLDEIYSGEVAEQWKDDYSHTAAEFEATCIRTLRAFQADERATELFYKAFGGLEVLPLPLHGEYQSLRENNPICANELLVPIGLSRFHALMNRGRVLLKKRGSPYIVRAGYSSEIGLTFDGLAQEENDL